jgi:hypothetical protein
MIVSAQMDGIAFRTQRRLNGAKALLGQLAKLAA